MFTTDTTELFEATFREMAESRRAATILGIDEDYFNQLDADGLFPEPELYSSEQLKLMKETIDDIWATREAYEEEYRLEREAREKAFRDEFPDFDPDK